MNHDLFERGITVIVLIFIAAIFIGTVALPIVFAVVYRVFKWLIVYPLILLILILFGAANKE